MKIWQKIGFILVLLVLILVIIATWGSIASILFIFLLISAGTMFLMQKFLIADRENDFVDDQNG